MIVVWICLISKANVWPRKTLDNGPHKGVRYNGFSTVVAKFVLTGWSSLLISLLIRILSLSVLDRITDIVDSNRMTTVQTLIRLLLAVCLESFSLPFHL